MVVFIAIFSVVGVVKILDGRAADYSGKGDVNNDGFVTIYDLSILLSNYRSDQPGADVNLSGQVDHTDLNILLSHYGQDIRRPVPPFQLGANTIESGGTSSTERTATVRQIIGSGTTWVRINLIWSRIEPRDNNYDPARLAQYDDYINKLHKAGVSTLVTVSGVPGWAHGASDRQPVPAHMADFMRYIADHYKGKVMGYQILNEVNAPVNWPVGGAASYSELLSAVYPATKAADPSALVATSGFTYNIPETPVYIEQLYQAGRGANFDVLTAHLYPLPCKPPAPCQDLDAYIRSLRSKMVNAGDSATQLWITEFGFSTATGRTYQDQVDYARYYLPIISRFKTFIPRVVWYELRDHYSPSLTIEQNKAEKEYNFGVYDVSGNPKPVRQVLRDFMAGNSSY